MRAHAAPELSEAVMKPKKKAGALSRSRPAANKKSARPRAEARKPEMAAAWTPLMEERREGGGPLNGADGRREVDRAKEDKGNEDESGGPDA
jgi:hypothetical protein